MEKQKAWNRETFSIPIHLSTHFIQCLDAAGVVGPMYRVFPVDWKTFLKIAPYLQKATFAELMFLWLILDETMPLKNKVAAEKAVLDLAVNRASSEAERQMVNERRPPDSEVAQRGLVSSPIARLKSSGL